MFVDGRGSTWGILRWQWKRALVFFVVSTAVVVLQDVLPAWLLSLTHLPTFPLAVVGGAIGIFVSFRTNSAYDRWWEGRKLWGALVNVSRHFCSQALMYLPRAEGGGGPHPLAERLVRRHVLYVHVFRCLLRGQDPWDDQDVKTHLGDEDALYRGQSNPTHAILHRQFEELALACNDGQLSELRMQSLDQSLRAILDAQGGCERIKKTPFPRGYMWISQRLIVAYGILLPLGLVSDLGWTTVPITVLVCMSFLLIGEVGRVLEDPFSTFWPALPLFAISRTIEANLRDRLGDDDIPLIPGPNERGVLM